MKRNRPEQNAGSARVQKRLRKMLISGLHLILTKRTNLLIPLLLFEQEIRNKIISGIVLSRPPAFKIIRCGFSFKLLHGLQLKRTFYCRWIVSVCNFKKAAITNENIFNLSL